MQKVGNNSYQSNPRFLQSQPTRVNDLGFFYKHVIGALNSYNNEPSLSYSATILDGIVFYSCELWVLTGAQQSSWVGYNDLQLGIHHMHRWAQNDYVSCVTLLRSRCCPSDLVSVTSWVSSESSTRGRNLNSLTRYVWMNGKSNWKNIKNYIFSK